MIGEWQGSGRITAEWCEKDQLSVRLIVREDGAIAGAVGDARIREGYIQKNRRLLILLGQPKYIIHAKLDGSMLAAENIQREAIELLLTMDGHELVGEFRTSGTKNGGRESVVVRGESLRLSRVQQLNTEIGQISRPKLIG